MLVKQKVCPPYILDHIEPISLEFRSSIWS